MSNPLSVVIASDSGPTPALLAALRAGGFELRVAVAASLSELAQAMAETRWDVILLAPGALSGLDLERVLAMAELLRTPVIELPRTNDPPATPALLRPA